MKKFLLHFSFPTSYYLLCSNSTKCPIIFLPFTPTDPSFPQISRSSYPGGDSPHYPSHFPKSFPWWLPTPNSDLHSNPYQALLNPLPPPPPPSPPLPQFLLLRLPFPTLSTPAIITSVLLKATPSPSQVQTYSPRSCSPTRTAPRKLCTARTKRGGS